MVPFDLIEKVKHGLLEHEKIKASRLDLFILLLIFQLSLHQGFSPRAISTCTLGKLACLVDILYVRTAQIGLIILIGEDNSLLLLPSRGCSRILNSS